MTIISHHMDGSAGQPPGGTSEAKRLKPVGEAGTARLLHLGRARLLLSPVPFAGIAQLVLVLFERPGP